MVQDHLTSVIIIHDCMTWILNVFVKQINRKSIISFINEKYQYSALSHAANTYTSLEIFYSFLSFCGEGAMQSPLKYFLILFRG